MTASSSHDRGDLAATERRYRYDADHGDLDAMVNLGRLLHERGDFGQAEKWYMKAVDRGGYRKAMFYLAQMWEARGQPNKAEKWYRRAHGDTTPLNRPRPPQVPDITVKAKERWSVAADRPGVMAARLNLEQLLREPDRLAEAEQEWRRAAARGHGSAIFNLGLLLQWRGDLAEAEERYRQAADRGNVDAKDALVALLREQGRLPDE